MASWLLALALAVAPIDWGADLDFLRRELPKAHPNAFHAVTREAWEAGIARLRERAPSLPPATMAVEISRIVAMIGDGHTRLTLPVDPNSGFFLGHTPTPLPPDPALHFHQFPVRFFWRDDGLYISAATRPELIGRRVLNAEPILRAVAPLVSADNEMGRRLAAADALAVPEVWAAVGIPPRITLDGGGELTLEPTDAAWAPKPDERRAYFDVDGGIVRFTYNEVSAIAPVLETMMPVVERSEALVIDLRQNPGGNGSFNRLLMNALVRSKRLQQPGRLFVLIGRRTFSAAVDLCVRMEQNTTATFVGEPTGGRPNGYGDSRKLTLPSSGLTVRVATLYWQPSDARDGRDAVAPDLAVPPGGDGDATMARVRAIVRSLHGAAAVEGEWSGTMHLDDQLVAIRIAKGRFEIPESDYSCALRECARIRVGGGMLFGVVTLDGRAYAFTASRR